MEYDTLTVFLLKILLNRLEGKKQESTKLRNFLPTSVVTLAHQGGLNQMLLFFLRV